MHEYIDLNATHAAPEDLLISSDDVMNDQESNESWSFMNTNNIESSHVYIENLKFQSFHYKHKQLDRLSGHPRIWPDKAYF